MGDRRDHDGRDNFNLPWVRRSSPVAVFAAPRTRFQQLSNAADRFALHQCADNCPGRLIDPEQSHNHRIALNRSI